MEANISVRVRVREGVYKQCDPAVDNTDRAELSNLSPDRRTAAD